MHILNYNVSAGHIANNIITSGNSYTYTRRILKTVANETESSISSASYKLMKTGLKLFSADYSAGASANFKMKLNEFANAYNALSKKIGGSGSKKSKEDFNKLTKFISDNKSALKQIGITLDKNELKIDEEKLDKASSYKITSAFKGDTNILSNIIKYATRIGNDLKSKTVSEEQPSYTTVQLDDSSASSAISSSGVFNALDALSRYGYTENNRSSITDMIKSYVANYNNLIAGSNDSLIDELKNITTSYRERLSDSGINITDDNLSVDDDALNNADIDNIRDIFSGEDGYAKQINEVSRQLFEKYVQAASNNITLVY